MCGCATINAMKWWTQVLSVCVIALGLLASGFMLSGTGSVGEVASNGFIQEAQAATDGGLLTGGRDGDYNPDGYGSCEFVDTVNNVIQFLIKMTALIAVIVFLYAGFLMVSSRGDAALITQAKGMFANVLIGFVIMITAFLVVNTVLGILVGGAKGGLTWQKIDCTYANESADADPIDLELEKAKGLNLYEYDENGIATNYRTGGAGGSCTELTSGRCSVSNLINSGLFTGNEEAASRVCNKESGGTSAWSGADLCKDGNSFSGGWFQINIIAHADKISGCAGAIELYGSGAQGGCLDRRTNSAGTAYCAQWNCAVVDDTKYAACRKAVEDWDINSRIANTLYRNSGNDFTDWRISAGLCNASY